MMKFLCKDEFMHSGDRIYTAGTVYDITEETVNKLITVDKQHVGGALRFFTPVDEAAAECMKAIHRTEPEPVGKIVSNADGKGLDKVPAPVTMPAQPVTPAVTPPPVAPTAPPVTPPAAPAQPPLGAIMAPPKVTQPPALPTAPAPAQPSRDTLVKEAKSLGLKVPFGTSNNDLMMLITAARQRLTPEG
jgi:hypothetical protein